MARDSFDDQGNDPQRDFDDLVSAVATRLEGRGHQQAANQPPAHDPLVAKLFGPAAGGNGDSEDVASAAPRFTRGEHIHVKSPGERYSTKRYTARNEAANITAEKCSERDLAYIGVYVRSFLSRAGVRTVQIPPLRDHEVDLLKELAHRHPWSGAAGATKDNAFGTAYFERERLPQSYLKALLNDSTSGGQEIVPAVFDDSLIITPLLYGELFPRIDLKPLSRGSSVEGAAMGEITTVWGLAEGTAGTVFNTASLISEVNTGIKTVTAFLEVGRDLASDSPIDVGIAIVDGLGKELQKELDRVIAVGNGSTEVEGIFVASGVTSVPSTNGTSGVATVDDGLGLQFGIGKQFRKDNQSPACFLSNDTSYKRFKSIATGVTGDDRLLFGMNPQEYRMLESPYLIQNNIANNDAAFGNLRYYRMYRRLGMRIEVTREGQTLTLKNTELFAMRARFGGRVVDADAFVTMTDLQD